jgi:hypothetical protein
MALFSLLTGNRRGSHVSTTEPAYECRVQAAAAKAFAGRSGGVRT